MLTAYCPEMNEARPAVTQIDARMSPSGSAHWFLRTPVELSGRGVTYLGKFSSDLAPHKNGWNEYKVTRSAFERIKSEFHVSTEQFL